MNLPVAKIILLPFPRHDEVPWPSFAKGILLQYAVTPSEKGKETSNENAPKVF